MKNFPVYKFFRKNGVTTELFIYFFHSNEQIMDSTWRR